MTADFNWFLNKQGPRGQQGVRGEQGFSPVITVAEDTAKAYILRIQTQDDTFLTPNLRGTVDDLGGTYVRYNPETGQVYAGSPDIATTETFGVIRLATQQDVTDLAQDAAITPDLLANYIDTLDFPNKYVSLTENQKVNGDKLFDDRLATKGIYGYNINGIYNSPYIQQYGQTSMQVGIATGMNIYIGGANDIGSNIVVIRANNPYVKNSSGNIGYIVTSDNYKRYIPLATTENAGLVKPDGSTVFIDENGVISAIGGGSSAPENMVTTDTAQEITGSKLFSNGLKVGGYAGISDNNGEQFICVDPSHNGWTIGCQNSDGWFSNVHIKRGASGDYINIDSGNISEYMPDNVVTEDNLAAQPVIQELQSALTESYDLLAGNGITISENTAAKTTTISLATEFAFKHIVLTQSEYDALATKDENTMYIIVG